LENAVEDIRFEPSPSEIIMRGTAGLESLTWKSKYFPVSKAVIKEAI